MSNFLGLMFLIFVLALIAYWVLSWLQPTVPGGLKLLPESQRDGLRDHEIEVLNRWAAEDDVKGFFDAVELYVGDPTGQEIEKRQYPRPVSATREARGIRVNFSLPVGMSQKKFEEGIEGGGAYLDVPEVTSLVVEPVSPGRAAVVAVTRAAFEKPLGRGFLE